MPLNQKRSLINPEDVKLSIQKQCGLLGLARSSYYYETCSDDAFNLAVMKEIDRIYTEHPYYGKRRISTELKFQGYNVGVESTRALMRRMGIEAIYPKPNLSRPNPEHKVYPYLLRGVAVGRKNQVWSTDITYVRMKNGFLYLTAVMDWYSRYVLAWRLSNSLDGLFCREVLLEALTKGKPEIFNTDQGVQYTSMEFTRILERAGILISMDGKGRALDNVWIERLWRTVKQEEIYIREYGNGCEAHKSLTKYFRFYNESRRHSSLGNTAPAKVYEG